MPRIDGSTGGGGGGLTVAQQAQLEALGFTTQRVVDTATPTDILVADGAILFDTDNGTAIAISLPAATVGKVTIPFKDIGGNASVNNITVNRVGTDTIVDIAAGQTSTVIVGDGFSGAFTSNGVDEWMLTYGDFGGGGLDSTAVQALIASELADSPVLVTPALGTPASGTLTNCTGLPLAGLATQAEATIVGRAAAAGTGVPSALTAAQVLTLTGAQTAAQVQSLIDGSVKLEFVDSDTVAGSAAASIGLSSLGIAQGDLGVAVINWVRNGTGAEDLSLFVDNDVTQTNYNRQRLAGVGTSTIASTGNHNRALISDATSQGGWAVVFFRRNYASRFTFTSINACSESNGVNVLTNYHTGTGTTIDDLDLNVVSGSAYLGVGSSMTVYKVLAS